MDEKQETGVVEEESKGTPLSELTTEQLEQRIKDLAKGIVMEAAYGNQDDQKSLAELYAVDCEYFSRTGSIMPLNSMDVGLKGQTPAKRYFTSLLLKRRAEGPNGNCRDEATYSPMPKDLDDVIGF